MGVYLNSKSAYTLYKNETEQPYFVDKTLMLKELFPLVRTGNNHICITRPRRFGKTVMANMIASFFSKARDAHDVFDALQIARFPEYEEYLNQYSVIQISFNELGGQCSSYQQYIERIEKRLVRDLRKEYPEAGVSDDERAVDALLDIYAEDESARFIFVLDEWDFIFHQKFIQEEDKKAYLMFLRDLLKDKPYVRLAYMTGILPIAKYSSGSELNMFAEYTMATEERFSDYFGFTESEVDDLYQRYQQENSERVKLTKDELMNCYDGHQTKAGKMLYNPCSIVLILNYNIEWNWCEHSFTKQSSLNSCR
ncbi:MAG: AAA family ATPase [Eubacteriales bacterium]|nr:AAA family ATPase [Eubacteriales bacterium]